MSRIAGVIVDFVIGIIELLLGIRLVFSLFGVGNEAGIVRWVYDVSQPLVEPFLGAFDPIRIGTDSLLELSVILAMIVYGVIGYILVTILRGID